MGIELEWFQAFKKDKCDNDFFFYIVRDLGMCASEDILEDE